MDSETQKTETLYEFLGWLEKNKKRVVLGGGALLLLVGGIATVLWLKKQQEFKASEALSTIRLPLTATEAMPADTLDKLQKLTAEYAGTAAALRAELIRGALLYSNGKYAEAQAVFDKFSQDHPENRWVSEAYYGLAVCLDAQNKTNEAVSKYEDFARRFSTDPKADEARLHLATLLESMNRPADAVKEYDRIVKATTYGQVQGEAQERLRRLLAKYPNLAPTNPPPVSPMFPNLTTTGLVSTVRTNPAVATNPAVMVKTNLVTPKPAAPPAQPK